VLIRVDCSFAPFLFSCESTRIDADAERGTRIARMNKDQADIVLNVALSAFIRVHPRSSAFIRVHPRQLLFTALS